MVMVMIVLVSDLHLTDCRSRSTINTERLLWRLKHIVQKAQESQISDIRLVLLGDTFEILKSKTWLDRSVRPWEPSTAKHQNPAQNEQPRLHISPLTKLKIQRKTTINTAASRSCAGSTSVLQLRTPH